MQLAIKPETVARLDEIANSYQLATVEKSPFTAALSTAVAINELRSLLTPDVMAPIMQLMNSPLGFLTDRTGRPNWKGEVKPLYTVEVVRDALIEATLRGFHPVGNEFNIIAERFYGAKNGFTRKVSTYPGLTNFSDSYSIPKIVGEAGAIVVAEASWNLNGKADTIRREFAVKGDKFAGADSYTGKAERKLFAAVYKRISGQNVPDNDAKEVDIDTMARADGHEVNHDDPRERAMDSWRKDCEATEADNAKLRAQGVPEDQLDPMPEPPDLDKIPGLEACEAKPKPSPVIPWREKLITGIQGISGKKLGELSGDQLVKLEAAISQFQPSVRKAKPALEGLLAAVKEGISELKASPTELPLDGQ